MFKILIINPNSSKKVTENLAKILVEPPQFEFHYYTAPKEAPAEISGTETSEISARVCLADLLALETIHDYDGFLVCCYSDHPLTKSLAQHLHKPVLGIMQATLLYSLLSPFVTKLFILTSFNEWEPLLDQGVVDFVGNDANNFPHHKFEPTQALDVSVLGLSDPVEWEKIRLRVDYILNTKYTGNNINCVLLGCAGMAGLDLKLAESFPGTYFVDSVKIGVELLAAQVRFVPAYTAKK